MRTSDARAFRTLLEKARTGAADPSQSFKQIKDVADIASALMARMECDRPPTEIIRPQGLGKVIVATTGITPSAKIPVKFTRKGRVIGVSGCIVTDPNDVGPAAAGHVAVSIEVRGSMNLITNGESLDYVPLPLLSGVYEAGKASYLPVDWPANPSDQWFVTYTSIEPVPTSGSPREYTATLAFLFEADPISNY